MSNVAKDHPVSDLSIRDLVSVSSSLKNIVSPSFGPSCRPTLLTNNTGQVVFTKNGHSVFSSICLSHPVAKCILETLDSHVSVYGDGCKTLILYLCELLRAIEANFAVLSCGLKGTASKNGISRSLHNFVQNDFTRVCGGLTQHVSRHILTHEMNHEKRQFHLECIIRTALKGSLPDNAVDHLATLIANFIFSLGEISDKQRALNMCFQNCVQISLSKPYLSSYLTEGLFFHGVFRNQLMKRAERARFVFTLCSLEEADHKNEYFMAIDSDKVCEDVMLQKTYTIEKFLLALQNAQVSLIMTSQKVPDFVLHACSQLKIDVVSCLEEEDIEFLSFYSGKLPVTSVNDEICDANICEATCYEQVLCSGKPMLRLVCASQHAGWQANFLFLYAPTDGLREQLKTLVRQCFKVAGSWYSGRELNVFQMPRTSPDVDEVHSTLCEENDHTSIKEGNHTTIKGSNSSECTNSIAGGGFFEFLLSHLVEKHSTQDTSTERNVWAAIIVRMLHAVPQTLFHNLRSQGVSQASGFLNVCQSAKRLIEKHEIVGFNPRGILCDTFAAGVLDVMSAKVAACFAALDLAVKLLRVDSIVGVKRLDKESSQQGQEDDQDV